MVALENPWFTMSQSVKYVKLHKLRGKSDIISLIFFTNY